jgi:predicted Zn-dependent peptidase
MFSRSKLGNGLTVITIPLKSTKAVTLLLMVGAGSRYETSKINGISHFLEHMFFKGSKKFPTTIEIANIMDGIGGIDNAGTEKEWTDYWVKCSSEKVETAIDVLSSMIKEPLFQAEEIEREKGVIVEELNMYRDDPKSYIDVLGEMNMFGDTPLGWDIGGSNETVKSLTREDFIKYMNSLYAPGNMVFLAAGNITPQKATSLAKKYLSDLPKRGKFSPVKKIIKNKKPTVKLLFKETDQANIALNYYGPSLTDEKRFAARVLAAILGGGMSSRLFIQVRERRGLAYHVGAHHAAYTDIGYIGIAGGLNIENLEAALKIILAEIELIKDAKVPKEELQKGKDMIKGRMALALEDSRAFAEMVARQHTLTGKVEMPEETFKKIDAVTAGDVQNIAQEIFTKENANLAIIGPFKSATSFTKILEG